MLFLLIGAIDLVLCDPARASQILGPDRVVTVASTSAEQFALMGGVFLLLGGAFVFAPQIISGVNGFFARLFGRPRKAPPQAEPEQAAAQIHPPVAPGAEAHVTPEEAGSEWEPEPEAAPGQAVSRLRKEISSAWGREGDA